MRVMLAIIRQLVLLDLVINRTNIDKDTIQAAAAHLIILDAITRRVCEKIDTVKGAGPADGRSIATSNRFT